MQFIFAYYLLKGVGYVDNIYRNYTKKKNMGDERHSDKSYIRYILTPESRLILFYILFLINETTVIFFIIPE